MYPGDWYVPLETWEEIAYYDTRHTWWSPYQLSGVGVNPVCPNLTITEDGHYAVFGCKTANKTVVAGDRLTYGDDIQINSSNSCTNKYGTSTLQVIVFDLWNISVGAPARVTDPLFLKEGTLSDIMVLN